MPNVESARDDQDVGAAWEQCKENAMPIKRGRDPKKLRPLGAQSEISNRKAKLESEKEAFEEALVNATSDGPMDDPLATWIKYIKWTQDNFPSGSNDLLALLERCTREFKDDERYRNNEKYLKVWIGYADMLTNPSSVFKYLRENKIGTQLALYYVATAWTAERRGDFPLADKAYSVGLEKQATPLEFLKKRQREFQRRMSRRWLKQAERERNGEVDPEEQEAEASRSRSLQTISRTEAGSMHRPVGNRRVAAAHPNISGRPTLGAPSSANEANAHTENTSSSTRFAVFEQASGPGDPWRKDDWGDENGRADDTDRGNGPGWKHLASVSDLQKENALDPGPWTDQGFGPGRTAPVTRRTRGEPSGSDHGPSSTSGAPDFDVFVEDGAGGVRSPRETSPAEGAGLKERAKADKSAAELLMKKPLQNFRAEKPPQTTRPSGAESTSAPATEAAPAPRAEPETRSRADSPVAGETTALGRADEEDMTINTRLALDDMFEMFGSPSMRAKSAQKPSKAPPVAEEARHQDYAISGNDDLHDEDDLQQRRIDDQKPKSGAAPFAIFGADAEQADSAPSRKPFSIFGEGPTEDEEQEHASGASSSRQPFSIFGDDAPEPDHGGDQAPEEAPAPRKPFSIFGDAAGDDDDEASPARPSSRARKPFSIFGEESDGAAEADAPKSGKPFSIFGDAAAGEGDDEGEDARAAPKSGKPFSIFGDAETEQHSDSVVEAPRARKPFSIFSEADDERERTDGGARADDDDSALSFAPLEAILEASSEVDDSVNSSLSRHG